MSSLAELSTAPRPLEEIWILDGRIAALQDEIREAEIRASAPYKIVLKKLQGRRTALFEEAIAADVSPEEYPFGTLRIEVPAKLPAREIDVLDFMRRFPQHIERCVSSRVLVGEAQKVLSEADFLAMLKPRERIYGDPVLKLIPPPAPKIMQGAKPKRKKSEILRERCDE